jgi:hypothetical protein
MSPSRTVKNLTDAKTDIILDSDKTKKRKPLIQKAGKELTQNLLEKREKEDKYQKFTRVRSEIRKAKIKNYTEYKAVRNKMIWPSRPEIEFAEYGWKDWEDYLGCETKPEMFSRIKNEIQKANIANFTEYETARNKMDWPSRPEREFAEYGWKDWEDYLGRKLPERKVKTTEDTRIPFTLLQEKVKSLGIQRIEDYQEEAKKHSDWPSTPKIYQEYTTFDEFASKCVPLDQLRKEVREYHIVLKKDYQSLRKQNDVLHWPRNPLTYYADLKNRGDLVGKEVLEQIKRTEILPYEKLKHSVQKAGIKSYLEYEEKRRKHKGRVSNPYRHYTKTGEWKSYPDLFGTK